jgi:hypothetical protein
LQVATLVLINRIVLVIGKHGLGMQDDRWVRLAQELSLKLCLDEVFDLLNDYHFLKFLPGRILVNQSYPSHLSKFAGLHGIVPSYERAVIDLRICVHLNWQTFEKLLQKLSVRYLNPC